jgi:hypothetical protein
MPGATRALGAAPLRETHVIQAPRLTQPLLILLGGVLSVVCLGALNGLDRAGRGLPDTPRLDVSVLSPRELAALSGGFAPALADMDWMRATAMSTGQLDGPGAERLFGLLDRVTVLDPSFEPAYHFGALLLSVGARRPDLSDRLLERARAHFPRAWSFPFYLGFNAFYHHADFDAAGTYMAQAAELPGAPPFLADLARRFSDQEQNLGVARQLIERMLRVTQDPVLRLRLQTRLAELGDAP